MKRSISAAIVIALLLGTALAIIPASAAEPKLSTNKTTYTLGEAILVSASSDNAKGKDWIGIAPKELTTGGTIAWEYVSKIVENYDITCAPNRGSNDVLAPYMNFPAGDYVVYLIPDDLTLSKARDQGKILASVEISIVDDPNASLKSPTAVTYELDDATSGLADGTLTITLPESHYADDIYMWWANEDGILEDYTRLARFKVPSRETTKFTYTMTPNTLIPAEATKLLVYTYSDRFGMSEECVGVALPEGAGYDFPTDAPIIEFQSVSDIHIGRSESAEHFRLMLEDIVKNSPNSSGIFANGDLIDSGSKTSLWKELWDLYDSVENAPDFFPGIGNHEYNGMSHASGLESFIDNIRMPEGYAKPDGTQYYDVWVDGYHFIFLADARTSGCDIGETQYDWLEARLAEKKDDRPVFLFFHQPMKNTVAGSMESEGWWALQDDERMREILADHPEIFFFNGHTHWILDSYNTMYGGGDEAAIFNTSSVSYLWQSYDVPTGVYQEGSEGFYVKVYKDKVLLLGRDFANGKWVSSAQFVVNDRHTTLEGANANASALETLIGEAEKLNAEDYTEESWSALVAALEAAKTALDCETQEEINSAKNALDAAIKALITKPVDEDKDEDEKPTVKPTDKAEDETDEPTEPEVTDPPLKEKSGCGSSFSALGVMLTCIAGAALVFRKRK